VDLKRGPLILVNATEELLGRKSSGSGLGALTTRAQRRSVVIIRYRDSNMDAFEFLSMTAEAVTLAILTERLLIIW
jgi:hypothetical protein